MSFFKFTTGKTVQVARLLTLIIWILVCTRVFGSEISPDSFQNALLKWNEWTIPANQFGNPGGRCVSLDEWEELVKLSDMAEKNEKEPSVWKVIYCLSGSTDMVQVDSDGAMHLEKTAMTGSQREFCSKAFEQFKHLVFAYSGGNAEIESVRREIEEPFRGEYGGTTFFWPKDFIDFGDGIDTREYDSVIGHFYPGPVRTPFASGTVRAERWCRGLGHSSVMLDPYRETGAQISLMAKNTLREWLNQIASIQKELGYYGMPDVSSLESYAQNPSHYYMRYIVTPHQWRNMKTRQDGLRPPNKSTSSEEGFIREWLVCGPFFAKEETALDTTFFKEESTAPAESETTTGKEWQLLKSQHPEIQLREFFPVSRRDSVVFVHTYVFSPDEMEAKLWIGSPEPFTVRLNGKEGIKVWEGSARDTVVRNVNLKAGWNRLLVKKLDQNSGKNWWFTARFTSTDNSTIPSLEYSAAKPDEGIVKKQEGGFVPIEIKYHAWDEVKDDYFGKLPVLSEQHLDKIIGQKGIRIHAGNENNYLFIDVSQLKKIDSRVLAAPDKNDSSLNNELNFERETAALIRYTAENGSLHDLLFIKIDMVEPFLDLICVPSDDEKPDLRKSIPGYILRDGKPAVVINSFLGDLPLNEFDMLRAKTEDISIETYFSKRRIIHGENFELTIIVKNIGEKTIDIGTLELSGFHDGKTKEVGNIYNFITDESRVFVRRLSTIELGAGPIILEASLEYEAGGETAKITKPVPLEVLDAVDVTVTPENSLLQTKPDFDVVVTLRNNLGKRERGRVRLELPKKWKSRPSSHSFDLKNIYDSKKFKFTVEIPDDDPDGAYTVRAVVKRRRHGTLSSTAELELHKSFRNHLVRYSFDKGIEGDFAITEGTYKVGLSREKPFAGPACLKLQDNGGSHYGHVWIFNSEILNLSDEKRDDIRYSYNTEDYPIIDFHLRTNTRDSSLGIHVILDDDETGYGIILNGEWDKELSPRPMIGRVGFVPDGKWRHVVIDLDKILDEYLGNIPHRVLEIKFGDTREMDFGWWTGMDKYTHFIDEFSIRKR